MGNVRRSWMAVMSGRGKSAFPFFLTKNGSTRLYQIEPTFYSPSHGTKGPGFYIEDPIEKIGYVIRSFLQPHHGRNVGTAATWG